MGKSAPHPALRPQRAIARFDLLPAPTCPLNGPLQCEIKGGTWNPTTCTCRVTTCPTCGTP